MSIGAEALKKNLEQLAVFGGEPAFADKLHVGRPNIGDIQHLKRLLDDILERRWLTNYGKYVQEFEQKLAGITGVKHCIAMCNGTIALEIAIRAAELKGEVIVPSMTFIATAHALQWQEITPVFCDIDPQTYNIDPRRIEEMITPRTTGIIGVHLYGRPCDIEALAHIAKRKRLKLIFDAAHAFGCSYHGKMIGGFGDAEVFSFHATKFINSFEGGAVLTNDDELARRIRLMKNFGFTGYDSVEYIGTNGKMTEIAAAMGLVSLQCLGRFVAANRRNYDQYAADLRGVPGVRLMAYDERERNNFQYVILETDEQLTRISRDDLIRVLHAENILARRYFYPGCHRMEPYLSFFPHAGLLLPHTERLARRVMSMPTGTAIGKKEVGPICQLLKFCVEHGGQISTRLQALPPSR